jgi:hypothetical protein
MRNLAIAGALLVVATGVNAAGLDSIRADVMDPNAPRGVARTFDATNLTVRQLQSQSGKLTRNETVGVWCNGEKMGGSGASAFDVFSGYGGGQIDQGLRKIGVTLEMKLTDVCWRVQKDFESRRR